MIGIYEDHGVRFRYPEGWELDVTEDGPRTTVAVNAPRGAAFAFVTLDETRPEPGEMAEEALEAMREEYPGLDAAPAHERIAGHRAVGHDVDFFSLDMVAACAIRCFQTARRTVLIFAQWSDLDDEGSEAVIRGVRASLEETDG